MNFEVKVFLQEPEFDIDKYDELSSLEFRRNIIMCRNAQTENTELNFKPVLVKSTD
jgi:hypothetical protein